MIWYCYIVCTIALWNVKEPFLEVAIIEYHRHPLTTALLFLKFYILNWCGAPFYLKKFQLIIITLLCRKASPLTWTVLSLSLIFKIHMIHSCLCGDFGMVIKRHRVPLTNIIWLLYRQAVWVVNKRTESLYMGIFEYFSRSDYVRWDCTIVS